MTETSTFSVNKETSAYWPKAFFESIQSICCVHMEVMDLDSQLVFRMPCGHIICYPCMMNLRVSSCCVCRRPLELQVDQVRLPQAAETEHTLQFFIPTSLSPPPMRRHRRRRRQGGRRRNRNRSPSVEGERIEAPPPPSLLPRLIDRVLLREGLRFLNEPIDLNEVE